MSLAPLATACGDDSGATSTSGNDDTTTGGEGTTEVATTEVATTDLATTDGGETTEGATTDVATTEADTTGDDTTGDSEGESSSSGGGGGSMACEIYANIMVTCFKVPPSEEAALQAYCDSYLMDLDLNVDPMCSDLYEDLMACASGLTCMELETAFTPGGVCAAQSMTFGETCAEKEPPGPGPDPDPGGGGGMPGGG
ncbi:MAG: hypothetical protein AAF799_31375 [Myxococcota bacterium]